MLAGVPLWCCTDSGVVDVVILANAVSGICWPALLTKKKPRSASGLCRYWVDAVITTRYWFSGL